MRLAAIIAAASISYAAACQIPQSSITDPEPRIRSERIDWRSSIGIEAAHRFVFDDCVRTEDLEAALAAYGEPHGLSSRDVAESIVWGLFHHREQLPMSQAPTIEDYIDEQIDRYGERFVAVTSILFGHGPYDRMIRWYLYDPIRSTIGADEPESLRNNVGRALMFASPFIDTRAEYERMLETWNGE